MNQSSEFTPVGKHVESSHRLELDFYDQQDFIFELGETSRELEVNPLATPVLRHVNLGRIALLDNAGNRNLDDKLWVKFSEADDGRRSASIDLLENHELTRINLSKTENKWSVWPNGAKTPSQSISNEQLVATLYPKIANKETFQAVLDTAGYDSIVIPHLLSTHLGKSAHRRQKILQYKTSTPTIQGVDKITDERDQSYLSSIDTNLQIFENNGRTRRTFSTRAPYSIGKTTIQKSYGYQVEASRYKYYNTEGKISISSDDGYSQSELARYAETDQLNNDPLFSLHHGLHALRLHYGLDEETAA